MGLWTRVICGTCAIGCALGGLMIPPAAPILEPAAVTLTQVATAPPNPTDVALP